MQRFALLPISVAFISIPALAQDVSYQCTNGTLERRVEIVSEGGLGLPCEVHYYKDTEMPGERQVLWTAQNDAGYCEEQADLVKAVDQVADHLRLTYYIDVVFITVLLLDSSTDGFQLMTQVLVVNGLATLVEEFIARLTFTGRQVVGYITIGAIKALVFRIGVE